MNPLALVCAIISSAISAPAHAQITLEHTYDDAGYYASWLGDQIYLWDFEEAGTKYVMVNDDNSTITMYNLDHSLFTGFSFASAPDGGSQRYLLYLSQHLFDLDDGFEFLYVTASGPNFTYTRIYDQDGSVLLNADGCGPWVLPTEHQQQYPIWNTAEGAKLLVSCNDQTARVYSLPGNWLAMMSVEQQLVNTGTRLLVVPNPAHESVMVRALGLAAEAVGEVLVHGANGQRFYVPMLRTAGDQWLIDIRDLAAGDYTVSWVGANGAMISGRFVKG